MATSIHAIHLRDAASAVAFGLACEGFSPDQICTEMEAIFPLSQGLLRYHADKTSDVAWALIGPAFYEGTQVVAAATKILGRAETLKMVTGVHDVQSVWERVRAQTDSA